MEDVARLAGVSPQTVSRTLRGYQHVSPAAREKVLAAVSELGYRRNSAATALASGRVKSIGVVALNEGSFRFEVMAGIASVADVAGWTMSVVTTTSLAPADVAEAVSRLLDQSVAAVVLALAMNEVPKELKEALSQVPVVAVAGFCEPWASAIAIDSETATRNAVRYLLDLGHETVGYVAGVGGMSLTDAWRSELESSGRRIPEVVEGDWSPASGYAIGQRLARSHDTTALLVAGDEMAFGLLRAFDEAGIRVPADISVMGAANDRFSPWTSPALSSISEPLDLRGSRAATYLLHRLENAEGDFVSEPIVPELIIRDSTAAPPA